MPAAVRMLIEKKVEGVILVSGIGKAAKAAIEEARRGKVPAFGFLEEHAIAGAIVAREPTLRWGGFEAGRLAGRILQGRAGESDTVRRGRGLRHLREHGRGEGFARDHPRGADAQRPGRFEQVGPLLVPMPGRMGSDRIGTASRDSCPKPLRNAYPMKTFLRIGLTGLVIAGIVAASVWFLTDPNLGKSSPASPAARPTATARRAEPVSARYPISDPRVPLFSNNYIEDSGYDLAFRYSLPIADRGSLPQCYESAEGRSRRGLAEVLSLLDQLAKVYPRPEDYDHRHAMLQTFVGLLHMYDGRFIEASPWFEKAVAENPDLAREVRANLLALRGVAALRRGEIENCVACLGPSSCIFPIAAEAVHQRTEGSREAIRWFTAVSERTP